MSNFISQYTGLQIEDKLTKAGTAVQPEGLTKAAVGLGNVDNTSDVNKPISTATQTALNGKADLSHSHTLGNISDAGSMASQSASSVSITGGAIDGATVGQTTAAAVKSNRLDITKSSLTSTPTATDGNVYSGYHTPASFPISNVTSVNSATQTYIRVGNVVTVAFVATITPANVSSVALFDLSLPIVPTTLDDTKFGGSGTYNGPGGNYSLSQLIPNTTNKRMRVGFSLNSGGTSTATIRGTYTYWIN